MKSDIEIAQHARLLPITKIARHLGIRGGELELHGAYKAKLDLALLRRLRSRRRGKYIVVTGMTPTPLGEGKTVTTIGVSMALNRIGRKAVSCIRQPSLGPVFGIKGGAAGGGYAQVVPMEDLNLHLTGDFHAVGLAHNLAAAFLDNHLFRGNRLGIDESNIFWQRVVDINDRSLRSVRIAHGGGDNGIERTTGFMITAASEVMAILALATSYVDLRARLGRIVLALTKKNKPVTADDLKVAGSMAVLLKDALKPTLVQTIEGTPCIVHAGPFGNIAHGNSSVIADRIALGLADYVVTESGFGADCGAEKFFDIKCRQSGLVPDAAILVASVRALKMHSGRYDVSAGKPLDRKLMRESLDAVRQGSANLTKQIENVREFGVPVVVALNMFDTDTPREIALVREIALASGADECQTSQVWRHGSKGGVALARAIVRAAARRSKFRLLYEDEMPLKEKIERIATMMYGASSVEFKRDAGKKIELYSRLGWGKLPVCMAKTHLSLSHDPKRKGRPEGFALPIYDVQPAIGAGFIAPLCGAMRMMPGLPSVPSGERIDIDRNGKIRGLF